jgi:hypothetical protein
MVLPAKALMIKLLDLMEFFVILLVDYGLFLMVDADRRILR